MKKHNLQIQNPSGFTLVEMLVVIAIIGILASIITIMLGTARDKARAVSAKSSMKSMITEAALHQDSQGRFPSNLCSNEGMPPGFSGLGHLQEGDLQRLSTAVNDQVKRLPVCSIDGDFGEKPSFWAASVDLSPEGGAPQNFCVDSRGFSGVGYLANQGLGICAKEGS